MVWGKRHVLFSLTPEVGKEETSTEQCRAKCRNHCMSVHIILRYTECMHTHTYTQTHSPYTHTSQVYIHRHTQTIDTRGNMHGDTNLIYAYTHYTGVYTHVPRDTHVYDTYAHLHAFPPSVLTPSAPRFWVAYSPQSSSLLLSLSTPRSSPTRSPCHRGGTFTRGQGSRFPWVRTNTCLLE